MLDTPGASAGTILLKARLDNADEKLTPGQFVEVAMTVRNLPGALLIPSEALQAGPNGNFVYVAKPDNTVELRMVQTIPSDRQLLIVEKGLKPGEKVITDGQLRLTPGAKYEVRTASGGGGASGKGDASKEGGGKAGKDGAAKDGAPKDAPKPPAAAKG